MYYTVSDYTVSHYRGTEATISKSVIIETTVPEKSLFTNDSYSYHYSVELFQIAGDYFIRLIFLSLYTIHHQQS